MKYLWLIISLLVLSFHVSGQNEQFRYLMPHDGLQDGTITSIMQDSSGLMWFATNSGLNNYDGYSVKSYSINVENPRSLPAREVKHLFLDSKNNLWISTVYGLCRYNRSSDDFDRFQLPDYSKIRTNILTFSEIEGAIIINTGNRFFYFLTDNDKDESGFKEFHFSDAEKYNSRNLQLTSELINDELLFIYHQTEGDVLLLAKINRAKEPYALSLERYLDTDIQINDVLLMSSSDFCVVTNDGISLLVPDKKGDYISKKIVNEPGTKSILLASDQSLWLKSDYSGISKYDFHTGQLTKFTHNPNSHGGLLSDLVNCFFEDFSGNIWIGHHGVGLSIYSLHKEGFNTIIYDPNENNTLSTGTVMCFEKYGDEILIGTDGGPDGGEYGLNIMRPNKEGKGINFEHVEFPDSFMDRTNNFQSVWDICRESSNVYWLASNFGLIKATRYQQRWSYEQFMIPNQSVLRKIFIDEHGNMWIGSYSGLFFWPWQARRDNELKFYQYSTGDREFVSGNISKPELDLIVTDIMLDSKQRFWISTLNGGLYLLKNKYATLNLSGIERPELDLINYSAYQGSINNNEINSIREMYEGSIWCCTQGGGINILNPETGIFEYITTNDGLPGNSVFSVLPDKHGNAWASTNRGLSKLNILQPKNNIINFSPSDGIQGDIFMVNSSFESKEGMMYFGGRKGFTFFKPNAIHPNSIQPKILFTDLKIFQKNIEIGDTIRKRVILPTVLDDVPSLSFTHKEYEFSIGIAAIHYEEPNENKIVYKLEGYDKDWVIKPASDKYVNYANLSKGTYTLMVRAINSDGKWTDMQRNLSIHIIPPWWEMWYTHIAEVILILLILSGVFTMLLRQKNLQYNLQMEKMGKKNIEKINEEKLKFFTDISHELKTPLSLVIAPLEDLAETAHSFDEHYFRKQSSLILRNAKLLKKLIDQIIEFRRANAGKLVLNSTQNDIGAFVQDIVSRFEIYRSQKNTRLIHYYPEKPLLVWFDTSKLEKIIFNLLSNSFNYVSQDGIISIIVEEARESNEYFSEAVDGVKITVYNEGEYIPKEKVKKIFERFYNEGSQSGSGIGLALTKSLVEIHKGNIIVDSIKGDGTSFSVFLPKDENAPLVNALAETNSMLEESSRNRKVKSEDLETFVEDKSLKILLIEDNVELREFLKTVLSRYYNFFEAPDGESGLSIAEETMPDLIISDVIMPGINGYKVCKELKENIRTCHIPVVLLTAKNEPEHMVEGYESGADAYVPKPFEIKVLLSNISRLIKNRELIRNKFKEQNFMVDREADLGSKDEHFLKMVNEEIERQIKIDSDFTVNKLSEIMNMSATQIYRKIKALTGFSTTEYIRTLKLSKAADLLNSRKYSVKEVCFRTGFNSPSYFVRCFKTQYKLTPTEFMYSKIPSK
jgi:signal transduction histidine kinase/ligand-binding sensor domain-containing protein/DNA-binding NarL/FixJ family response regulator